MVEITFKRRHLTANDCKIAEWILIKQAQNEDELKKTAVSTAINNDGPISSRTRSHNVAAIKQQISKLESNNRLDGTLAGVFQAVVR
ncbi:unnamed protein product [Gongylonema pulchrum]|uniref:Transposase n=1 Tax=Gongylonema pulchrum TaxID=637853 RepID=A0A183F199_9BILA|nr:unnamed protein product [Gongylonema pulchrum]